MSKYLKYLRYVLRHKYLVYKAGRELGLGRFQLLMHDISKLRPSEFVPYACYFYVLHPIVIPDAVKRDFDRAWLLHQNRNPHHWQFWLLALDEGESKALRIPERYRLEMIADWTGMGWAFGESDAPRSWYLKNRHKMSLHHGTRTLVEQDLGLNK